MVKEIPITKNVLMVKEIPILEYVLMIQKILILKMFQWLKTHQIANVPIIEKLKIV